MAQLTADFRKRFTSNIEVGATLPVSFDDEPVLVLFGPSGGGKTTILRCLAGLETPSTGTIHWNGAAWFDADRRLHQSPQRRGIGYCFQTPALFPHLTVAGNIEFGLTHSSRQRRQQRAQEMMQLFGIEELASFHPAQLSGGQQQRVSLARTLGRRPVLMLLDEPMSALDRPARERLGLKLKSAIIAEKIPTVLVTHDRLEAIALADRIAIVDEGRIIQTGTIGEVFHRPTNNAVARIVGVENVLEGKIISWVDGMATIQIAGQSIVARSDAPAGGPAFVYIRAEEVLLQRDSSTSNSARNQWPGVVTEIEADGMNIRVTVDVGFPLTALITRPALAELSLAPGSTVRAVLKAHGVHVIARKESQPA